MNNSDTTKSTTNAVLDSHEARPRPTDTPAVENHDEGGEGIGRAAILRIARMALGIAAAAVALFAEKIAEDNRVQGAAAPDASSWWLFGLAGVLFAAAMWPVPRMLATEPNRFFSTLKALRVSRRRLFAGLLTSAVICSLLAVPLFMTLNNSATVPGSWLVNTGSWLLWILSLFLFAAAWVVWERSTLAPAENLAADPSGDKLPVRIEWLVMAGLLGLALLLRLPNLENAPPGLWFDEAQNGIVGQQLLKPDAVHVPFLGDLTQMGALYFYFQGLLINLLGNTILALRLPAALSGSLIVPMLYLLASRLYGWRVGLAAAGLLAFSTWNITFSRLGLASMSTIALDVAAYLCVMQALRTGRMGYYAGAGVLLGLALQGYYASRLVPFVLVALLVHRLITERARLVRAVRTGMVVFAVGALIAFVPVGTFAAQHWDVYNSRISTVSIFSQEGSGGNPNALSESINKHMLMFNFQGDGNGRHNLPGQPMLDWLTAALFFLGLGSCVARGWRWQYFFPVVWFVAALSGGVLSLLFEAPQAHRTLENSVVTSLLAGIALGQLWELVSRVIAPRAARISEAVRSAAHPRGVASREESMPVQPAATPTGPLGSPKRLRTQEAASNKPATTLPVRVHAVTSIEASAVASIAPAEEPVAGEAAPAASASNGDGQTGSQQVEAPADSERTQGQNNNVMVPEATVIQSWAPVESAPKSRRLAAAMILSVLGIFAAVGWVGSMSVNRYFNVQMKDRGVWSSMYTPETQAAKALVQYNATRTVFIASVFVNLPPSRYLAPGIEAQQWAGMQTLPLGDTAGKDVVIVSDLPSVGDLTYIANLYPHATFEPIYPPADPSSPLVWTIYIPASDIMALNGVHAQFFDPPGTVSATAVKAVVDKTLQSMAVDWSKQSKPGTVRLSSTLKVSNFGSYTFSIKSAENGAQPSTLAVDGYPVAAGATVQLVAGLHSIVATDTVKSLLGTTRVSWAANDNPVEADIPAANLYDPRKIEPHGLTGVFRNGDTFDGAVVAGRVDPVISAYFHLTPLPRPYTGEWSGRIYIPQDGLYTFTTEQLSKSRLFLDGNMVIENLNENSALDTQQQLKRGWHEIKMQFEDLSGFSHVYLYWTPPGGTRSIIPAAFLWPKLGEYPVNPESGPFPTLAQANGAAIPADRIVNSNIAVASTPQASSKPKAPPTGNSPIPEPPTPAPQSNTQPRPTAEGLPAEQMKAVAVLGGGASGPTRPQTAAADSKGNIYVYSDRESKIIKYDAAGNMLISWAVNGAQNKPLGEGSALLVQSDRVMLLDAATSSLLLYDPDGKPQGTQNLCQCYFPRAMTQARDGNYWVADTGGTRISKISRDGKTLMSIQGKGQEIGKFSDPAGVAESSKGILYVSDNGNSRIQTFSAADLKPLAQWRVPPSVARDGTRVATDSAGNVLVTEPGSQSVAMYDPTGKQLRRWAYSAGGRPLTPGGISPVGNDRFVVLFPNDNTAVVFSTTGK